MSRSDYKDAWQRYLHFVSLGGTKSFKELCAAAGIDDPFGERALNGVAQTANSWLDAKRLKKTVKCDKLYRIFLYVLM